MLEDLFDEPDEVVAMKVEFDLVPDWSTILERIARYYGTEVQVGVEVKDFVIRARVPKDKMEEFTSEIDKTWALWAQQRKRAGRWQKR